MMSIAKDVMKPKLFYFLILIGCIFGISYFDFKSENSLIGLQHIAAQNSGFFRSPPVAFQSDIFKSMKNSSSVNQIPKWRRGPARNIPEMDPKFRVDEVTLEKINEKSMKKILMWNEAYGEYNWGFGFGNEPFKRIGCEYGNCFVTSNRSLIPEDQFDAIMFHFRSLDAWDLPLKRSVEQRWIFYEVESASYIYQDPTLYNGLFNWTFTYMRNSDIVFSYGRIFQEEKSPKNRFSIEKNYAFGKTKMAAWFVSNCDTMSGREHFVQQLTKFMPVDVYGKCGNLACERDNLKDCNSMLEKNYKFYFSFENSLCPDYVTEKFFSIMKLNILPVVYGLGNYAEIAPVHSYVDAMKFNDPQSLVEYLVYLNNNDTAYNEYFWWKPFFSVDSGWSSLAQSYCDLCQKLNEDQTTKVYSDLKEFFVTQRTCKTLKRPVSVLENLFGGNSIFG